MRFSYDDDDADAIKKGGLSFSPTTAVWAPAAAYDADVRRCAGSADTSGFTELIRRAWQIEPTGEPNESSLLVHGLKKTDGSIVECEAIVHFQ